MKYQDLDLLGENEVFSIYGDKENCKNVDGLLKNLADDREFIDTKLGDYAKKDRVNLVFIGKRKVDEFEKADNTLFFKWNVANTMSEKTERTEIIKSYTNNVLNHIKSGENLPAWWMRDGIVWYLLNERFGIFSQDNQMRNNFVISVLKRVKGRENPITFLDDFINNENNISGFKPEFNFYIVDYLAKIEKMSIKDICTTSLDTKKLVNRCFYFYQDLYNLHKFPTKLDDVNSMDELLLFLDINFNYGYMDKETNTFRKNYDGMQTNYRTASIGEILENRVFNCCDTSRFLKYYFDKNGIESRQFCIYKIDEKDELSAHFFTVFKDDNSINLFEATNSNFNGIHKYNSVDEVINEQKNILWGMKEHIKEIKEPIPAGLDMQDLKKFIQNLPEFDLNKKEKEQNKAQTM